MTPLARQLRRDIEAGGPITVAAYMATALCHPEYGYYSHGDPFGLEGDFVTAPEVSQMFGELIGLWCAEAWRRGGCPDPVRLVEIGPGRGTLMADALRAMDAAPACRAALDVHLVENSPGLRQRQRQLLGDAVTAWHDDFAATPEGPLLLIANELFDALPIHQFVRGLDGWRERMVGIGPADGPADGPVDGPADGHGDGPADGQGGGLRFVLAPGATPAAALLGDDVDGAPLGSVAEVSPAAIGLAHEIGRRIAVHGGAALIVDYASARGAMGDTLQAVRRHGGHEVLDDPGSADLSARVDFAAVARAASQAGASVFGPVLQGDFLRDLGIETRARALMRNGTERQRGDVEAALARLTDPGKMGTLFQALAIMPPNAPPPAGFEDAVARQDRVKARQDRVKECVS